MQAILNLRNKGLIISISIVIPLLVSYLTVTLGILAPILSIVLGAFFVFLIIISRNPFIGLMSLLIYCFIVGFLVREISVEVPFGYIVEIFYVLIWVSIIIKTSKDDWSRLHNDLCVLALIWFSISVLEIINPAGASVRGWLHEIRSSGLDSFVLIPAGFLLFRNIKHLNIFFIIIIAFSLLGTINGIKQVYIGLFPGEQAFLAANPTHMVWGQLRAFSFYRDAGQFGASQAQLVIICGILAFGPFKLWKRALFLLLTFVFFYGMLISGTRGSLFALVPGAVLAIFLFKNLKVLFFGSLFIIFFVGILKFTYIGSSNSYVHRLRSALDPEDASLNVRFNNQEILKDYLKDYPFGGGLGILGYAGQYNEDKFLSTVAPDSYWVKIWAMYGIVGLIFWFSMMMYILGKCCGIVWRIENAKLRVKLIALTAGACGIFLCSYGNEVINALPSSIIVYLSFVLIFLGPEFDRALKNKTIDKKDFFSIS